MGLVPFKRKRVKIDTDVRSLGCDQSYIAHLQITPAAASANGVLAASTLTANAQTKTTGITNPAVTRGLSVVGNVSGITGNVVITGKNINNETITETIALNGTTPVLGAKAFKSVSSIILPAQSHVATAQVETATCAGTVSTAGNAAVTVTAAGLTGSPKTIAVALAENDDANAIATKIRAALAADTAVAALFTVSGATDKVILTKKVAAANDTTLNIAIADGTGEGASVGVTTAASSANTTAGVIADTVSVGTTDVLGLPYKLSHNTVLSAYLNNTLEGTAATVTVSATALESNTIDLNTSLDGNIVDIYLIV